MGKIWNRLTKKEPEKDATPDEIKQLKLNLEREQLKSQIAKTKQSQPKHGFAKIWSAIHDETPERRKARMENIKRGLGSK